MNGRKMAKVLKSGFVIYEPHRALYWDHNKKTYSFLLAKIKPFKTYPEAEAEIINCPPDIYGVNNIKMIKKVFKVVETA